MSYFDTVKLATPKGETANETGDGYA
jgi:hypothetical protein